MIKLIILYAIFLIHPLSALVFSVNSLEVFKPEQLRQLPACLLIFLNPHTAELFLLA